MYDIVEAIHKALHTQSTWVFVGVVALLFALVGGALALLVDIGYKNTLKDGTSENRGGQTTAPTLLISRKESTLPISIEANITAYILRLNPDLFGLAPVESDRRGRIWPDDFSKVSKTNKSLGIEQIAVFDLANPGSKPLLDVSLLISTQFYEPKRLEVRTRINPDKTVALDVDPEGKSGIKAGMIVVRQIPGTTSFEGFGAGTLVKSIQLTITIPIIAQNSVVRMYAVNHSRFVAGCDLPSEAQGLVAGDTQKHKIMIVAPDVTGLGNYESKFAPSQYPWKGIPGY